MFAARTPIRQAAATLKTRAAAATKKFAAPKAVVPKAELPSWMQGPKPAPKKYGVVFKRAVLREIAIAKGKKPPTVARKPAAVRRIPVQPAQVQHNVSTASTTVAVVPEPAAVTSPCTALMVLPPVIEPIAPLAADARPVVGGGLTSPMAKAVVATPAADAAIEAPMFPTMPTAVERRLWQGATEVSEDEVEHAMAHALLP